MLETQQEEITRDNLQLGRRLFHMSAGTAIATLYLLFVDHQQIVYIIGGCACLMYMFEQIRIAYPELSHHFEWLAKILLRSEEQMKESAAVPYMMAILLTILSFPKVVAVIAIYTLAIGDPLAAIIGIRFGKHKIMAGKKSIEGSLTFFVISTGLAISVLSIHTSPSDLIVYGAALTIGSLGTIIELLPIRLDDNITIPISTAIIGWIACAMSGIPL